MSKTYVSSLDRKEKKMEETGKGVLKYEHNIYKIRKKLNVQKPNYNRIYQNLKSTGATTRYLKIQTRPKDNHQIQSM